MSDSVERVVASLREYASVGRDIIGKGLNFVASPEWFDELADKLEPALRAQVPDLAGLRDEAQSLLTCASARLDLMAEKEEIAAYDWWIGRRDTLVELLERLAPAAAPVAPQSPTINEPEIDSKLRDDAKPSSEPIEAIAAVSERNLYVFGNQRDGYISTQMDLAARDALGPYGIGVMRVDPADMYRPSSEALEPPDKGPFKVVGTNIGSDDFTHDVMLQLSGDFETYERKKSYAEWVAATLNAALEQPQPDSRGGPVAEVYDAMGDRPPFPKSKPKKDKRGGK